MSDALIMIIATLGLVAGNFVYQVFGPHEWSVAAERSFFQIVAVAAVWIVMIARELMERVS